jgi:molybdopterin molybdotransferase
MLTFEKAQKLILENVQPLPIVNVDLPLSLGLVLAEEIVADRDLPPFHRSAMDGYAVAAADTAGAPVRLPVVGECLPGAEPTFRLQRGRAAVIMTGAPLPEGADAVQMVELCREEAGFVEVTAQVAPGQNVAHMGEDARAGETLLEAGAFVSPSVTALLAAVGKARVAVRWRPKVAVGVTGDEVIEPWREPSPYQIRNANGPALTARLRQLGAETTDLGIIPDDETKISDALTQGREADMIVLTGGVSMGRLDMVTRILKQLGAEIIFERVAIKPGKPTTFALLGGCPVFALPGNPVSCQVALELFAVPALRAITGLRRVLPPFLRAELKDGLKAHADRVTFHPARLKLEEGIPTAYPLPFHGSGDFVHFAAAQCLVIVPAGGGNLESSQIVDALLLEGSGWPSV